MRIEDYALLGDLQTAALISRYGSVDWCCLPRFDSGACFAAMLGGPEHGRWLLAPAGVLRSAKRRYRRDTLILESVYETDEGSVRAVDFMPPRGKSPDIVRIVEGLDGTVRMRSELVSGSTTAVSCPGSVASTMRESQLEARMTSAYGHRSRFTVRS